MRCCRPMWAFWLSRPDDWGVEWEVGDKYGWMFGSTAVVQDGSRVAGTNGQDGSGVVVFG